MSSDRGFFVVWATIIIGLMISVSLPPSQDECMKRACSVGKPAAVNGECLCVSPTW